VSGNKIITRDLPYICHLKKLVKLDISNNGIHFLPGREKFEALENLHFLLLDRNEIVGWHQLEILMGIKTLRLLTVDHNPCTKIVGYRQFIVSNMANLWSLDGTIVMDFER
jgi:Leucine-rich repeat